MNYLMRGFDLQPHQAADFVGNLSHESTGYKTLQEIDPLLKGSRRHRLFDVRKTGSNPQAMTLTTISPSTS